MLEAVRYGMIALFSMAFLPGVVIFLFIIVGALNHALSCIENPPNTLRSWLVVSSWFMVPLGTPWERFGYSVAQVEGFAQVVFGYDLDWELRSLAPLRRTRAEAERDLMVLNMKGE